MDEDRASFVKKRPTVVRVMPFIQADSVDDELLISDENDDIGAITILNSVVKDEKSESSCVMSDCSSSGEEDNQSSDNKRRGKERSETMSLPPNVLESEDEVPQWVDHLLQHIWTWEDDDLDEVAISPCKLTSTPYDSLSTIDCSWVLLVKKKEKNYSGVFIMDDKLQLRPSIPIDPSTKISFDEDLIGGSDCRYVTICSQCTGSNDKPFLVKQRIAFTNYLKSLEDNFIEAIKRVQSMFSDEVLCEMLAMTGYQENNHKWMLDFCKKIREGMPKIVSSDVLNIITSPCDNVISPVTAQLPPQNVNNLTIANNFEKRSSLEASTESFYNRRCSTTATRQPIIFTRPEDRPYVGFKDLKLFLTTFNVNMRTPTDHLSTELYGSVSTWLQYEDIKDNRPDLVVICMQECGGLNRFSNFLSDLDAKIQQDWKKAICIVLEKLGLVFSYENNVGCTYMIIFVKRKLLHEFSLKHRADLPLGQGGMANKGACIMQISIYEQKFLFVGVHLAPHDHGQSMRMRQIDRICNEYKSLIKSSDFMFWLGDFNFRAAVDESLETFFEIPPMKENDSNLKYAEYRKKDQWKIQRLVAHYSERNDFYEMNESEIYFGPSYKFEPNKKLVTDANGLSVLPYIRSHRPSWCDRIFHFQLRPESNLRVLKYDCEFECTLSDHKPVYAKILTEIEYLDKMKKMQDYRANEIKINSNRPSADLDNALHTIPCADECFKLLRTYQIDTRLKLKDDVEEAQFLFRCPCGDQCVYYRQQLGVEEFMPSQSLLDHVRQCNSPVSFITINEWHGQCTAGYEASIGFDLQITERNIHELYKLKGMQFADIKPKSRMNNFEQALIDLIFCLYSENPQSKMWLKGADKYIAVNLNVKAYMHGINPTALCYIDKPICQMSVREISDIVKQAELFNAYRFPYTRSGSSNKQLSNTAHPSPHASSSSFVKRPALDCPKEIVFAIDTIIHFINSIPSQQHRTLFAISLFQPNQTSANLFSSSASDAKSPVMTSDVGDNSSGFDDDFVGNPQPSVGSLSWQQQMTGEREGDGESVEDAAEPATSDDGSSRVVSGSSDGSQKYLDEAIEWLTGSSNYIKSPYNTQLENSLFIWNLAKALLLYFKSIENSLFGNCQLPLVNSNTSHVELLEALFVPDHSKAVILYFFGFLAEVVVPFYSELSTVTPTPQMNQSQLSFTTANSFNDHDQETIVESSYSSTTSQSNLDSLKNTLVGACFSEANSSSKENNRRYEIVATLLRRSCPLPPNTRSTPLQPRTTHSRGGSSRREDSFIQQHHRSRVNKPSEQEDPLLVNIS